ncbi:unnamed protein product [Symbiodinium microadriaticum]|nr:unnamed protein product [Symbiodinium microadriaticum]
MESIPKDTAFRTRASLSRFVKALMLGEADPLPAGLIGPLDTRAEKDERFHIMLHNIFKADEKERKLTIRVIHLSRFVDYTMQSRQHAKLVLPEGSSLQLICEMSQHVSFHRVFSAKDLSVSKGSVVYFHSWTWGSSGYAAFAARLRPPLAPVQPTACVYHFCGPDADPEQGVLKVWHAHAGEIKSENNLTKLERYQSMAVLPVERAQLLIESSFRKYHNKGHAYIVPEDCSDQKQLPTAQHAGRHVYISQMEEQLCADPGALVNEPQKFDASADLEAVQHETADGGRNGFCIRLHNVPAKNLKFGMKVKVKLPDERLAYFQLDSHCCSVLRLPEGSSIEVESHSEEFPESKASVRLGPEELVKANGGNVYFYSAHDRQSWSEEEMALANKFCPLMILFPLYILVMLILICMVDARKKKRPLCHLAYDVGHASKGKTIIGPCIVWHFCNFSLGGPETLFLKPKPLTSKDNAKPGFAITSAQSCAVPAAAGFALSIWDNPEYDPDDVQKSALREKIVELDTGKFADRHVYVLWNTRRATMDFARGYLGVVPGAGKVSTAEWDAQAQAGTSLDLEAGKP